MKDSDWFGPDAHVRITRRAALQAPAAAFVASPLCRAGSVVVSLVVGVAAHAPSEVHAQAQSVSGLTRSLRARGLRSDALTVDFPPLADSGLAVPYTVEVQSPPGRLLKTLELLLPENPMPLAMKVRLPIPQERYRLSTRLRLAASQEAWVLATFDDGSQQGVGSATIVTSSACLDES
jgi:predicted secreted protein